MPSKSRRLPGGKVRRPATRAKPVTAPEAGLTATPGETDAAGTPAAPAAAPPPAQTTTGAEIPASRRQAPQTIQLPVDAMPSAAAGALVAGAPTPRRRGAVTPRATGARAAARSGPTSLDVAEASLTYVRTDLLRIFILALAMVGIIVVLAVVLH